jgi:hypothetical protein
LLRLTAPCREDAPHHQRTLHDRLALSVPALLVPYPLLTPDGSEAAAVDTAAYYQFVSVRSGNALDVAGASDEVRRMLVARLHTTALIPSGGSGWD